MPPPLPKQPTAELANMMFVLTADDSVTTAKTMENIMEEDEIPPNSAHSRKIRRPIRGEFDG